MSQAYIPTLKITPALDKILLALYQYHLLTTDLVVPAVGSLGSATTVKENIQSLEKKNYLFRFPLSTTAGRSPLVCVLSEQGMKYLRDERELDIKFYRHPSEWKGMSSSWLMHPLELNKFIIAADRLTRLHEQIEQITWEHDFLLKSDPLVATSQTGERFGVIPDAILQFTVRRGPQETPKRRVIWVELERDTHKEKAFYRKLTGAYWAIENGIFEGRYHHPIPRICFVSTVGQEHVEWMREQCRKLLIEIRGRVNHESIRNRMFHFASLPPLQGPHHDPLAIFTQPYWTHPFDEPGEQGNFYSLLEL
jgi:hypothetical protein